MTRSLLCIASLICWFASCTAAEEGPVQLFAEPKQDWEWDEDKRFDFLVERLASVEASLDAVETAITKASGKRGVKQGQARRADADNTMMDRKGGGPMRWNEFYGTTAEKFFYHPVDPNTTYRTNTFLRQMGSSQDDKVGNGVPSSQSLPVHQRPPQFDYIYRANREARDRAEKEAAELAGKIETLNQRRIQLEREQAELWAQLAFRAIQRLDIPRKPVLRFELVSASGDTADVQKAEALAAAARFLATALLIIEKAEDDQATAFGNVKDIVARARSDFDDALLNADAVAEDAADTKTLLGKYVALAKLLDDTSSNLSESYEVAMEGDRSRDLVRKERFRGLLQQSLVEYAQIVLALDELATVLKSDWNVKVDTKSKTRSIDVSWGAARVPTTSVTPDEPEPDAAPQAKGRSLLTGNLKGWSGDMQYWRLDGDELVGEKTQGTPRDAWIYTKEKFRDFELRCEFRLYEGNSGMVFGGTPLPGGDVGGLMADIVYKSDMKWMASLGFYKVAGTNVFPTGKQREAMLAAVDVNDWNQFVVRAQGNSVVFVINGVEVLDAVVENRPAGVIGFQLHGGTERTKIAFRDIRVEAFGK